MRLAILQMADEPQITSTAQQLVVAGYEVKVCGPELRGWLGRIGCDTILPVSRMESMGYDKCDVPEANLQDRDKCDLFVEIKIRNVEKITNALPRLKGRVLWWRVNGAQPEICVRGGDEVNLICPIVTACFWYSHPRYEQFPAHGNVPGSAKVYQPHSEHEHGANKEVTLEDHLSTHKELRLGDVGMAYTMWPPYPRHAEYDAVDRSQLTIDNNTGGLTGTPYCLCYNVRAWGYGEIVSECRDLGVKLYGSEDGQIRHSEVPKIAAKALALVHLKSVDCPGWALYEAMLAGCPVITGRLFNSRMLAYDLLEDQKTCIEFGVPASLEYGRGDMAMPTCLLDIENALDQLKNPEENRRIGEAGRKRLNELMWRSDRDGDSFKVFMQRNFP